MSNMFSDSLSFGMREAVDQGCEDEIIILTACKFSTPDALLEILEQYNDVYWRKHPAAADATRRAYAEGRVVIPRAEGYCCPIGSSGHSLYADWKEWQREVAQHAPGWDMGWCPRDCKVTEEAVMAAESVKEIYQLFPEKSW